MESILEFDKQLKQLNKDAFAMTKIVRNLFLIIVCPILLFPIKEDYVFILHSLFLFGFAITFHLRPLLYIKQNEKPVSIYLIIKQTPIKKENFLRSRFFYTKDFLLKIGCICLVFQLLGNLLCKNSLLDTCIGLLCVVGLFLLLGVFAFFEIKHSVR